ncbi:hypothetical protein D3C72_986280 [compost metagenome]
MRDAHCILFMLRHAQGQRAHPAQHQKSVVGAHGLAEVDGGALKRTPGARVDDDGAHHHVGMSTEILGGGQYGNIGA